MKINKKTHVYCTNCKHLKLIEGPEFSVSCRFEAKCDIWDFDDSKPLKERPYYKSKSK